MKFCTKCDHPCGTHTAEEGYWDEAWGYRAWVSERYLVSDCCHSDVYAARPVESDDVEHAA